MANTEPPKAAKASPTKRFFISVLIKDIHLLDAVVELVDNSVDSARLAHKNGGLAATVVRISCDREFFTITDNAAGISIEQAENYAFRFGRPDDAPLTPGAVGEFGVGMKRALFKIGRYFEVKSMTFSEQFSLSVDVEEWEKRGDEDPNSWRFPFTEIGKNDNPGTTGTTILVKKLHEYAVEEFESSNFISRLINVLKDSHQESIAAGLQITVNNVPVLARGATLLHSSGLTPLHKEIEIDISGKKVKVKLFAGVGEAVLNDAGWYIYCNGRQVERAEKTEKTGWSSAIDGDKTPKPHWQFRRFRGYAFFESDSPAVLPWNTTKTGLDTEAPAYRRVRSDIRAALREVIGFLNDLDSESSKPGKLTELVANSKPAQLPDLVMNEAFTYDASAVDSTPKTARITYTKDLELYEAVRIHLGVETKREVGEKTFDYYVQSEGIDER